MLISTTFGNETFENSIHKYHIFACRTESFPLIEGRQQHLWVVAKKGIHDISRHGPLNVIAAAPGCIESTGKWTTGSYSVKEGLVLKIFGFRKVSNMGFSRQPIVENLFIRLSSDAPLYTFTGELSRNPKAQGDSINVFSGRAYIMDEAELLDMAITEYKCNTILIKSGRSQLFWAHESSPEIQPRTKLKEHKLKNMKGEEVIVKAHVRKRAIQL